MSPLVVYTGTQVWQGRPEIRPSKKGRVEHGPGLYLTTSLETAAKYAKGRGVVLQVEIDPDFEWLEDAVAPLDELVAWVQSRPRLRSKQDIIDDLVESGGRGLSGPGMARVSVLVNLMVNYDAITGQQGPALAEFLASMGIGASHVRMGHEDWVVLFDPDKVLGWERVNVTSDSEWSLPPVVRRKKARS